MQREIGRYCCMKELRHALPNVPRIKASLIKLIICEKTFSENIKPSDPVVPEFNHEPSLEIFKKDILDSKIPELDTNEKVDEFIYKLRGICVRFFMNKNYIFGKKDKPGKKYKNERYEEDDSKLKSYLDDDEKNYIFECSKIKNGKIIYKSFKTIIPREICDSLKHNIVSDDDFKNVIFAVWLRYISLSNWDDMYQIRINSYLYKIFRDDFNIKLELCASPFNFQFPLYCSLFYDTDKHFQSMGSYIDIIKNRNITGLIEINPPYIEMIQTDIINKMHMEMELENRKFGCVFFMANWQNSPSVNTASKSKYLRKKFIPGEMTEKEANFIFDFYSDQDAKHYQVGKKTCLFILMNDLLWKDYGDEKLKKICEKFR